jgi:hypothetical protein
MKNQRNAIVWALVSWLVRRWVRQRAARVAGVAGGAARPGRVRSVLGALALVGVLAGAVLAWRRLSSHPESPTGGDDVLEDAAVGIA